MKPVTVTEFTDYIIDNDVMCYTDKDNNHLIHYYDEATGVIVATMYSYPKSYFNVYYIME